MMKFADLINSKHGYPSQKVDGEFGKEFDELVYNTFSTGHGKELLAFLEKNMLMKSIWEPNNNEINCYFMEGRNNLVRLFIDRKAAFRRNNT